MRRKTVMALVALLALSGTIGVIHVHNVQFEARALARGVASQGVQPVDIVLANRYDRQVEACKRKKKASELDVKKMALTQKKADGPDYNVNPADGTDFREVFKDSLFIGDSITHGLSYYKHVALANVCAELGQNTKTTLEKKRDIIKSSGASHIYIMLGMNDCVYTKETKVFIDRYRALIQAIREDLPSAKIYITSILPVNPANKKATDRISNERIAAFNKGLVELAKELSIPFIDIRPFLEGHRNFYEPDGIHVNKTFHRYWLKFIQVNYH